MELKQIIISDLNYVKSLLLSEHLVEVFNLIKKRGSLDTRKLSKELDISIPNASSKLTKLFTKGYLKRKEVFSDTGGIEYIYKCSF